MSDARQAFEEWARGRYCTLKPSSWNVNYYGDAATAAAFASWQAACASCARACDSMAGRGPPNEPILVGQARDAALACASACRALGWGGVT